MDGIVTRPAIKLTVGVRVTINVIITRTTEDMVVAITDIKVIIARSAIDEIVALKTIDGVTTCGPVQSSVSATIIIEGSSNADNCRRFIVVVIGVGASVNRRRCRRPAAR